MNQSQPIILSLVYKDKITELCKPLSNLGLSHFAMYIVFNDDSTFALSNAFSLLKSYYHEELYKEDYSYTTPYLQNKQGYYLCAETFSCSDRFRQVISEKHGMFPAFNIVRQHPECTFVFSAVRSKPCENPQQFYEQSITKFENFCLNFVENTLDIIVKFNPNYQLSFILSDEELRRAVIKSDYNDAIRLTPRQIECLWLASKGHSVKEIAKILKISFYTVEKHLKHIREIFNCDSLIVAIYKAIQRGIIGKVSGVKKEEFKIKPSAFARPKE